MPETVLLIDGQLHVTIRLSSLRHRTLGVIGVGVLYVVNCNLPCTVIQFSSVQFIDSMQQLHDRIACNQ